MLSEAQRINVKVGKVGTKHKWKPPVPARPDETNLRYRRTRSEACQLQGEYHQGSSVFGSDPCSSRTGQCDRLRHEVCSISNFPFLCILRISSFLLSFVRNHPRMVGASPRAKAPMDRNATRRGKGCGRESWNVWCRITNAKTKVYPTSTSVHVIPRTPSASLKRV